MNGIVASSSWKYREDIDGLRALAVAIVILFHFEFDWFPGGFVGVDVFFVISGFLITSLIARQIADNRFSLIDFYERRFRRIYPNLLIVLAVTVVLGFLAMVPLTYRPFGRSLIWATLSASNFAFIGGNGYFDPDNLTKPLLHTWSLGVEEQFYLVFPWLLILAAKRGYSTRWLIVGVVALSLALSVGAAVFDWAPSYFLLPTRFWELGIGALIAILPASHRLSSGQRSLLGVGGLLAIGWAALRLSESDPFPGYLALAPTLGAAAVIWASGGLASRVLSLPPLVWIGRLSFALYLWHWPLISIAAGIGLAPTEPYVRLAITALMLALSIAGYYLWEQPIRQRRMLAGRKPFFAALTISVLVLVGIGATIFQMKGVPQRLPEDLVAMQAATNQASFLVIKRCPTAESPAPAPCPLGDESAPNVSFLVVGDSHSGATADEIGDIARRYHLRGLYLGRGGCPALADLTRNLAPLCPKQYQLVLQTIARTNPGLIIWINQWSELVGTISGKYRSKLYIDGRIVPESERIQSLVGSLEKTLVDFGDRPVVTSLTIPEYQGKIPLFWNMWIERRGYSTWLSFLSRDEYRLRQTYVEKVLAAPKENRRNLFVLDPSIIFCSSGICKRTTDNSILYRDNTHLSHAGAALYAKMYEPFLARLADRQSDPR